MRTATATMTRSSGGCLRRARRSAPYEREAAGVASLDSLTAPRTPQRSSVSVDSPRGGEGRRDAQKCTRQRRKPSRTDSSGRLLGEHDNGWPSPASSFRIPADRRRRPMTVKENGDDVRRRSPWSLLVGDRARELVARNDRPDGEGEVRPRRRNRSIKGRAGPVTMRDAHARDLGGRAEHGRNLTPGPSRRRRSRPYFAGCCSMRA